MFVLPLTLSIAILRYRLWDIDFVINRTLVYGVLTAVVIGIYVVIVGVLGILFRSSSNPVLSLLATGIVAISFQPLRERLQRGINRLMFGDRDNPYAVLGHLSRRLEAVVTQQAVLPTIVETVAEALKLPYVAIALKQGEQFSLVAEYVRRAASTRRPDVDSVILPLVFQTETVGQLILTPRAPGEPFSQIDQQLLETIARQTGIVAYNIRLTQDLQRSRERLVNMREDERRHLRRGLHNGLGSALASMAFKLDAVYALIERDPQDAQASVAEIKQQIQASLDEVRHIAYDLRPPALDELGLVGALEEQIAVHNQGGQLQISLEAPQIGFQLAAAVEVAAYRIALEAVSNVVLHAEARRCTVRLSLDERLAVEIIDDGRGLASDVLPGRGMSSMSERAAELGGHCRFEIATRRWNPGAGLFSLNRV